MTESTRDGLMTDKPMSNQLHNIDDVSIGASEVKEMIARRAFDLYKQRGTELGDELSDWLRAEAEVVTMLLAESPEAEETRKQHGQPTDTRRNRRGTMKAGNGTQPPVRRLPRLKNVLKSNPA